MLRKALVALIVLVAVFAAVVALQPGDYRVQRSASVAAPASAVFAQVNDLHMWRAWSPFDKLDPDMRKTYSGPPAGTGAAYRWSGNDKAGEGTATIVDSRPGELVRIRLDFVKPFAGTAFAEFTFKPEGGRTVVTWALMGQNGFLAKAVCLFVDMDKTVGRDFEQGLAALKTVAETAARS